MVTTSPGVTISFQLKGLTGTLTHGPSGALVRTTPPVDNGGDGSSFSPTDLLASSLLSCVVTTMALQASREGLSWVDGVEAQVVKHMGGPPRRVSSLPVVVRMPKAIAAEHRARLEEIARGCPVARSLAEALTVTMRFEYV